MNDGGTEVKGSRLGGILVQMTGISLKTLQYALDRQKETGAKIGELLFAMGVVTEEQVTTALQRQVELRED